MNIVLAVVAAFAIAAIVGALAQVWLKLRD
jgi:hypothetical protein